MYELDYEERVMILNALSCLKKGILESSDDEDNNIRDFEIMESIRVKLNLNRR